MVKAKRNLTEGPIFVKIILFVLPIMATGIIQLLYNMADNIVVGRFSGDPLALAAVGSTSSLTNLILNLMFGISAGSGVIVAQLYGASNEKGVSKAVHTALTFSLLLGFSLSIIGTLVSRPALALMGTKAEVIDKAVLYLRIICIGIPASSVYNFGASILRATGDSKTPLIILICTGLVNVLLNLVFVIGFNMSVDGVAIATIISQYLSAIAVITVLILKRGECFAFSFKKICIDSVSLKKILRIGVPAGVQGSMFSISNVMLTSAINTFPTTTVSAFTIAGNIDGITYTAMNSFQQAAMTFAGQNYGAKKLSRVKKVLIYTLIQVACAGILVGYTELIFGEHFAMLYIADNDPNKAEVLAKTMEIMGFILPIYFMCGMYEVISGTLRGIGDSMSPAIISLVGICGVRILWIKLVFPIEYFNTVIGLYLCYPITWVISAVSMSVVLGISLKKISRVFNTSDSQSNKIQV